MSRGNGVGCKAFIFHRCSHFSCMYVAYEHLEYIQSIMANIPEFVIEFT